MSTVSNRELVLVRLDEIIKDHPQALSKATDAKVAYRQFLAVVDQVHTQQAERIKDLEKKLKAAGISF